MLPRRIKKQSVRQSDRIRCPGHLVFVRSHECVVSGCQGRPIEACHVRLGAHAGMSQKPDDTFAYSGCSVHHAESHRIGEASFQKKYGLDLLAIAAEFASKSPHRGKWHGLRN